MERTLNNISTIMNNNKKWIKSYNHLRRVQDTKIQMHFSFKLYVYFLTCRALQLPYIL
jgi:hypothetical protein